MIGKRFAHYEIESRLGAGGMGEVYLAEDTRLRRKVALKLLPTEQIGDAEKLARFEQEAIATSALNHPNITTIFETGDVENNHYIAIEYIEGRTLRELFDSTTLELRKVLDIAVQVADGLAAAHEARVVHRDLKPENIMVRDDGILKILDFGLAKLASRLQDIEKPVDDDETLVQRRPGSGSLTDPGMVLGTVSYMSPEQARGEAVDFRSDIFSFGSVLYEALARKRAFQSQSSAETMTAIIREHPESLQQIAPETPPELVRIISKAMSKDPDERYQSGKDLSLDLRALRRQVESGSISAQWAATSSTTPAATSPTRRKWWAGIVVLVAIAAALSPLWIRGTQSPEATPETLVKTRVTSSGMAVRGALSPDGRILAFVQKQGDLSSLWIRQLGAGTDVQIVEPSKNPIGFLTFTPDGAWLLFGQRQPNETTRRLYRIAAVGGAVREVLEDIDSTPSFAPDGNRFLFMRAVDRNDMRILVASLDGKQPIEDLYRKPEGVLGFGEPRWSPDGKEIAFYQIKPDGLFRTQIMILELETQKTSALPHPEWVRIHGMQWKPEGSGLYVTAQRQWQSKVHVFEVRRDGSGTRHITRGFDDYRRPSVAADGQSMAVTRNSSTTTIVSVPITGTTQENTLAARNIVTGTGHNNDGSYSPDGSRIAYLSSTNEDLNIWTMKPNGTDRRQLTFDQEHVFSPFWSPHGQSIAYGASNEGNLHVWVMDADGRNWPLTSGTMAHFAHSWSPDSQWLSFIRLEGNVGHLYKVRTSGGEPERIGTLDASALTAWSPDGEWILTWRGLGTRQGPELTLLAADGSDRTQVIDTSQLNLRLNKIYQLISMRWGRDANTLYAVRRENASENLVRLSVADGSVQPLTQFSNLDMVFTFSVSPDESEIAVTRGMITNDIVILSNLSGTFP